MATYRVELEVHAYDIKDAESWAAWIAGFERILRPCEIKSVVLLRRDLPFSATQERRETAGDSTEYG